MKRFCELTDFIPELNNDRYGEWVTENEREETPFLEYSKTVNAFVSSFHAFCNAHTEYDIANFSDTLERYNLYWDLTVMQEADVSEANDELIIALLFGAIRSERFSEGSLLNFFISGSILRWLERLLQIDENN